MSDFLYTTKRRPEGRLRSVLEQWLAPLPSAVEERHGDFGTLVVSRLPHDPAVVREGTEGLHVVIGEPLVGDDGPYARLFLETRPGVGSVTTDLMAFVPVFWASTDDGGLVLGTHVDAVAVTAGRATLDAVSAADFVAHGSIVHPYTLYEGVEQVAPALERAFRFGGSWVDEGRRHWTPAEANPYDRIEDAALDLRRALRHDLERALAGVDRAGMLLSAGEDSRAVLGAVPRGVAIDAFTFADWESREVGIARRIARAYGASFTLGLRGFGHYLEGLEPVARFVGSQHQFIDVHAWQLHERLGLVDLPVVLGGFSSDVLLKGYYSPTKARRSQPQKKHPGEHDPLRVQRIPGVRAELLDEAVERRERRRGALRELRPNSATEWMRIWPFGVRKPAAAFLGHRRLFRAHEPFMSNAVVKLSAAIPTEWKLDRRLFSSAMRPYLFPSRYIPHARNMFPYYGLYTSLTLGAAVGIGRLVSDVAHGRIGRHQGPWPDWWKLVRSDLFTDRLRRHPIGSARSAAIFADQSPEAIERLVRERWTPKRQLMFLQLAYLTRDEVARATEMA